VDRLTEKCDKLSKLDSLLSDYETKIAELTKECQNWEIASKESDAQLRRLQSEYDSMQQEISSLRTTEIQRENEIDVLRQSLEEFQSKTAKESGANKILESRIRELDGELKVVVSERDHIKDRLKSTRQSAEKSEKEIERLEDENLKHIKNSRILEHQTALLEVSLEELRSQVQTKEEEKAQLRKKLDESGSESSRIHTLLREKALLLDKYSHS